MAGQGEGGTTTKLRRHPDRSFASTRRCSSRHSRGRYRPGRNPLEQQKHATFSPNYSLRATTKWHRHQTSGPRNSRLGPRTTTRMTRWREFRKNLCDRASRSKCQATMSRRREFRKNSRDRASRSKYQTTCESTPPYLKCKIDHEYEISVSSYSCSPLEA